MPQTLELLLKLTEVNSQPVFVDLDGGQISSDGGVLLLGDVEQQIGIIKSLAEVIHDPRNARYVKLTIWHQFVAMLFRQLGQARSF